MLRKLLLIVFVAGLLAGPIVPAQAAAGDPFLTLLPHGDVFTVAIGVPFVPGGPDYAVSFTMTPGVYFKGTPWCDGVQVCHQNVGTLQTGSTGYYYPERLGRFAGVVTVTAEFVGGGQTYVFTDTWQLTPLPEPTMVISSVSPAILLPGERLTIEGRGLNNPALSASEHMVRLWTPTWSVIYTMSEIGAGGGEWYGGPGGDTIVLRAPANLPQYATVFYVTVQIGGDTATKQVATGGKVFLPLVVR